MIWLYTQLEDLQFIHNTLLALPKRVCCVVYNCVICQTTNLQHWLVALWVSGCTRCFSNNQYVISSYCLFMWTVHVGIYLLFLFIYLFICHWNMCCLSYHLSFCYFRFSRECSSFMNPWMIGRLLNEGKKSSHCFYLTHVLDCSMLL